MTKSWIISLPCVPPSYPVSFLPLDKIFKICQIILEMSINNVEVIMTSWCCVCFFTVFPGFSTVLGTQIFLTESIIINLCHNVAYVFI